MTKSASAAPETSYPLGVAARLTGLSPELLRAWERRYGAVRPLRTPGGTRRYRASDIERLRLLKAAVEAGHRIGQLGEHSDADLERLTAAREADRRDPLEEILEALDALDGAEAQRLLGVQIGALGPVRFSRLLALPLVTKIGERWASQRMGIASEHLATAVLRSMLGSALQPGAAALRGPGVVFATLAGERHELGLLIAALVAMAAGARPVYLGPELPLEDLLRAVDRSGAAALAISLVATPAAEMTRSVAALRGGLAPGVRLWIGGAGARAIELPEGVDHVDSLDQLEQQVALLGFQRPGGR